MTTATSEPTAPAELLPGYRIDEATGAWLTLPWPDDPDEREALARSSLGPAIIAWAEGRTDDPGLVHHLTGEPWRFTRGQRRFLVLWYALTPDGRWAWRSGVKRGAKGTGKDPLLAAVCNCELIGPVRFDGWAKNGTPVGAPHRLALVQIASNSEAQSKDVLRVANAMLPRATRDHFGIDPGETRTILEGGGRLELLTASEKSSEGDPATFIGLNESHHMTETSGGHRIADVARRNVGKSPVELQARLCEFTNAHQQGMDSVAERSFEAWQAQVSGRTKRQDILYDSIEAPPSTDLYDDASRRTGIVAAYMDAPWADLDRLDDEVLDPRTSLADSVRYYLNGLGTAEDAWIEPVKFDALAQPGLAVYDREVVALFLDCSKSSDSTGLVASRLSDGHVITLGSWQRPRGDRGRGWLAPRPEVDAAVMAADDQYEVAWFGVDPSPAKDDETEALYWAPLVDKWHRHFRERVALWASPGHNSVLFDMRTSQPGGKERNRQFVEAAERTKHDIDEDGALSWDGDSRLRTHTHNARNHPTLWGQSLGKASRGSSKLVDLAVCMVGARMGRQLVLNSGKTTSKSRSGKVW